MAQMGVTQPGPFSILYHGSLVPRNGLDLAVDALEIAKERVPAARLIVCGERSSFLRGSYGVRRKAGTAGHESITWA